MIKEALRDNKTEIYELWKTDHPNFDLNYLSFYFRNLFDQGKTLIKEQDRCIVASVTMNTHVLYFKDRLLEISYILGVNTKLEDQKKIYIRELMDSVLDEVNHNHLITLMPATYPKQYEPYGFQVIYTRKRYVIQREYLNKVFPIRVSYKASPKELLNIYQKFTYHFEGYCIRNISYYETLLKELELGNKHLVIYRDPNENVMGYLIYEFCKNQLVINEAIYLESVALTRMMKAIIEDYESLTIEVSQSEKLEKIFPQADSHTIDFMMARINNYNLFNKLVNAKVKTAKEAYALLKKPLWFHEYY